MGNCSRILLTATFSSWLFLGAPAAGERLPNPEARLLDALAEDRFKEARKLARTRGVDAGSSPGWVAAVAQAEFRAGELERALALLEELAAAISEERLPPRAALLLARLHDARGRREEAERLVRAALAGGAADPWVLYWAADVVQDRSESRALLEAYLDLAGEDEDPDRLESARGTIRVLGELGERRVWVPLSSPERLELPMRQIWNDKGRRLGSVVTARAGPKGKPLTLLVDTGSGGLFVVERVARKRGMESLASETTFGGGGDGRLVTQRGLFPELALGDLRFGNALLTTSPNELEPHGRYHGVLGTSVFASYVVTFDPKGKRLVLARGAAPSDASEPFWSLSGQMLVRAAVGEGKSGMFLLDTGATSTILSRSLVEDLPGTRLLDSARVRGYGGAVDGARWVRGVEVRFQGQSTGERDLGAVDLSLRSRLAGVEVAGFLGLDLLDGKRIVIDGASRTVRVGEAE